MVTSTVSGWQKLIKALDDFPFATAIVFVVAVVGALVLVTGADTSLTFSGYVRQITIAAAILGVGRGIKGAGKHLAAGK
jgi:hypothetical protein